MTARRPAASGAELNLSPISPLLLKITACGSAFALPHLSIVPGRYTLSPEPMRCGEMLRQLERRCFRGAGRRKNPGDGSWTTEK